MNHSLSPDLLAALRAGVIDAEAAARIRAALARDGWDDPEGIVFDEEGCALLLSLFEGRDAGVPVAEAIRQASEPLEIADDVLGALGLPVEPRLPLAEALRASGGTIDVREIVAARLGLAWRVRPRKVSRRRERVEPRPTTGLGGATVEVDEDMWLSAMLDRELSGEPRDRVVARLASDRGAGVRMTRLAGVGRQVREALEWGRGSSVNLWPRIAPEIGLPDPEEVPGWEGRTLVVALRKAAGAADISDIVMERVRAEASPRSDLSDMDIPAPANRRSWSAVAALAVAALVVMMLLPRWVGPREDEDFREVPLQFATAGEVNVDEIRSGPNATVFVEVPAGDEAPLIIWVNDGGAP